jgi:zinc transporter ZupT
MGFWPKKTTLAHQFPYPHEHSRHAAYAVLAGSLFFISSDNLQNLLNRFDSNIKWWAIYGFLLGFFYFFASPFLGKVGQLSRSVLAFLSPIIVVVVVVVVVGV